MTCPMLRYKIKSKVNGRSHWKEIKDGNKNLFLWAYQKSPKAKEVQDQTGKASKSN